MMFGYIRFFYFFTVFKSTLLHVFIYLNGNAHNSPVFGKMTCTFSTILGNGESISCISNNLKFILRT